MLLKAAHNLVSFSAKKFHAQVLKLFAALLLFLHARKAMGKNPVDHSSELLCLTMYIACTQLNPENTKWKNSLQQLDRIVHDSSAHVKLFFQQKIGKKYQFYPLQSNQTDNNHSW